MLINNSHWCSPINTSAHLWSIHLVFPLTDDNNWNILVMYKIDNLFTSTHLLTLIHTFDNFYSISHTNDHCCALLITTVNWFTHLIDIKLPLVDDGHLWLTPVLDIIMKSWRIITIILECYLQKVEILHRDPKNFIFDTIKAAQDDIMKDTHH